MKEFNQFRKYERNRKISSVKDARKISVDDVIKTDWESLRALPKQDLVKFAKRAVNLAYDRRRSTLNKIIEEDLPLPQAFRNWRYQKTTDDFSLKNAGVEDTEGLRYKLGDKEETYKGFATLDLSVNSNMSKNELLHKIRVASDFLDNETSTVTGYRKYLNKIITRISGKTGVNIQQQDYKEYWRTYNKLIEAGYSPESKLYGTSTEIQQVVYEVGVNSGTYDNDTILEIIKRTLEGAYEEEEEEYYGGFFEYSPD